MIVQSEMRDMISASAIGNRGGESISTQSKAAFMELSRSCIRSDFSSSKGSPSASPAGSSQTSTPAIRYINSVIGRLVRYHSLIPARSSTPSVRHKPGFRRLASATRIFCCPPCASDIAKLRTNRLLPSSATLLVRRTDLHARECCNCCRRVASKPNCSDAKL